MSVPLPPIVDAAFVTGALRRCGVMNESGRVADVVVEKSFPTLLSQFLRLRLTYEGTQAEAPGSVMLKTDLPGRPGGAWESGRREVAFYNEVAPSSPTGLLPRCFDARWQEGSGWHLLLEDLTDTHFVATQWPLPPSMAQCERIVRVRARFQAAWWDDARLGSTVGKWDETAGAETALAGLVANYERFADVLGERLSADRRDLYARLFAAAPRLAERYLSRRHMTIVQGDAHVWNCLLSRNEAPDDSRLFDWDAWRPDTGTDDLAYMMALHWYPDLRSRTETHLLDLHHAELVANGVTGYDRRSLQDDYRLSVLWQSTTPIWHHAARIPPVIWWNNLERIHLAIEDLGCRGLL